MATQPSRGEVNTLTSPPPPPGLSAVISMCVAHAPDSRTTHTLPQIRRVSSLPGTLSWVVASLPSPSQLEAKVHQLLRSPPLPVLLTLLWLICRLKYQGLPRFCLFAYFSSSGSGNASSQIDSAYSSSWGLSVGRQSSDWREDRRWPGPVAGFGEDSCKTRASLKT